MATKKEKQLTVLLLKERLERLTGKKVMLEDFYDASAAERRRKQAEIDSVYEPMDNDYANKVEYAIKNDWFEKLGYDNVDEWIMVSIYAFERNDEAKWFVMFQNEDSLMLKNTPYKTHPVTQKPLKSKYFELIVVPGRNEPWPTSVEFSPHGFPVNAKKVWILDDEDLDINDNNDD